MYAIIGANGYLGSYAIKAILNRTNESVIATARNLEKVNKSERVTWIKCDIQSDDSVKQLLSILEKHDNLKILYLAACHHPDMVEKNKMLAWDINVTSLSKFINKAVFASRIIYASTDSV